MLRTQLLLPLPQLLASRAAQMGDAIAFRDTQRSISFRALCERTARLAGHLGDAGLRPGEQVPIPPGNRVETVETILGVARASGIGMLGAPAELPHRYRRLANLEELARTPPRSPPRDDLGIDDPAWLVRTGSNRLIATQRSSLWSTVTCFDRLFSGTADPLPIPLPFGCAHLVCILGVLALGGTARLASHLDDDGGTPGYALLERVGSRPSDSDPRPQVCLTVPSRTTTRPPTQESRVRSHETPGLRLVTG